MFLAWFTKYKIFLQKTCEGIGASEMKGKGSNMLKGLGRTLYSEKNNL